MEREGLRDEGLGCGWRCSSSVSLRGGSENPWGASPRWSTGVRDRASGGGREEGMRKRVGGSGGGGDSIEIGKKMIKERKVMELKEEHE